MTKEELYLSLYSVLREAGLVKTFEQLSVRFFMGIASTMTRPTTGDALLEELKADTTDEGTPKMPDVFVKRLETILKPEDSVRYHIVDSDIFNVYYIILLNGDLEGRITEIPNCKDGVTLYHTIGPDDNRIVEALMLIGNGSPNVTNNTRGAIIKHELTHVLIEYYTAIKIPNFWYMAGSILTKDEIAEFTEFLCDFIQFDSSILNRYTPNPISKFGDALEFIFKPGTAQKYEPYMKAISGYFEDNMT